MITRLECELITQQAIAEQVKKIKKDSKFVKSLEKIIKGAAASGEMSTRFDMEVLHGSYSDEAILSFLEEFGFGAYIQSADEDVDLLFIGWKTVQEGEDEEKECDD